MKWLLVFWVIIMMLLGFFGALHADDTDKNHCFKVNWRLIIMFIMFPITPIIAHFCGL